MDGQLSESNLGMMKKLNEFTPGNLSSYVLLFSDISIPVIVVDKTERIVFFNRAYGELLDVNPEEVIGLHVLDVIPTSNLPAIMKTKQELLGVRHTYFNNKQAICHCFPIIENGECVGSWGVVLFHAPEEIALLMEQVARLQDEVRYYRKELKTFQPTKYSLDDIIGSSAPIQTMKETIVRFANTRSSTILVVGESGSGKELVAQSIHNLSPRNDKPLVRLNCAAIPENLFESELFGYEKGAFTGAKTTGQAGKFEQANNGTLFLDEISELPLQVQAKLLRVLQEREVTRLGGKQTIPLDVRVIAATNRSLEEMVEAGTFRRDLFYRLDILNIYVPSLKERGADDIRCIGEQFLESMVREYGVVKVFDESVWQCFYSYSWPGNVRELRNVIEKMYVNAEGNMLDISSIPFSILQKAQEKAFLPEGQNMEYSLEEAIEAMENKAVARAMRRSGNNISQAAQMLNISRPRIYRILRRESYESQE